MTQQVRRVFISYRRADNVDFVERIRDWFIQRYGRANVFMDFDSIPPFADFTEFIKEKIAECDAVLAIIGPAWVDILRQKAADFQPDYVRLELEAALSLNKIVAPVCIKGAPIPPSDKIPASLRPIFARNIAFLDSGLQFLDNIERIVTALDAEMNRRAAPATPAVPQPPVPASGAAPAGQVRYFEPFSASTNAAQEVKAMFGGALYIGQRDAWTADFIDGAYRLRNDSAADAVKYFHLALPGQSLEEAQISVDVRVQAGAAPSGAGLIWRFAAPDYYAFVLEGEQRFKCYRRDASGFGVLHAGHSAAIRPDAFNTLHLIQHAAQFDLYINGQLVASLREPQPLRGAECGMIALGCGEFSFDNFTIYTE